MNPWITWVKAFAHRNRTSYGCALTHPECSRAYHAQKARNGGLRESPTPGRPKRVIPPYECCRTWKLDKGRRVRDGRCPNTCPNFALRNGKLYCSWCLGDESTGKFTTKRDWDKMHA